MDFHRRQRPGHRSDEPCAAAYGDGASRPRLRPRGIYLPNTRRTRRFTSRGRRQPYAGDCLRVKEAAPSVQSTARCRRLRQGADRRLRRAQLDRRRLRNSLHPNVEAVYGFGMTKGEVASSPERADRPCRRRSGGWPESDACHAHEVSASDVSRAFWFDARHGCDGGDDDCEGEPEEPGHDERQHMRSLRPGLDLSKRSVWRLQN